MLRSPAYLFAPVQQCHYWVPLQHLAAAQKRRELLQVSFTSRIVLNSLSRKSELPVGVDWYLRSNRLTKVVDVMLSVLFPLCISPEACVG